MKKYICLIFAFFLILSPQKTGAVASLTNIRKTKPIRAAVLHPIHISVTEMEYQAAQKTIEVSHKIFIDDLEAILEKRFRKKFRLTLEGKAEQSSYIYDYLRQNFKLSLPASSKQKNEKESLLQAHFLGYEFDFEAIYIYAEYKSVKSFNQIKIENRILLDLFADQKNITHLRYGQVEKSSLLRTGKVEEVLEF